MISNENTLGIRVIRVSKIQCLLLLNLSLELINQIICHNINGTIIKLPNNKCTNNKNPSIKDYMHARCDKE
jgi:hypothetical protein